MALDTQTELLLENRKAQSLAVIAEALNKIAEELQEIKTYLAKR